MTPHWTFTDGRTLPVGTMYCIGRNYADHAREMGAEIVDDPIVFIKPPAAYLPNEVAIRLPEFSREVHHEVELVVVIGHSPSDTQAASPWNRIAGVGVGLDLTARDVQATAKRMGHPWAVAKSWKGSAPVSSIIPIDDAGRGPWKIQLFVNDQLRQSGSTSEMERSVEALIDYVESVFSLQPGDCIFTGTPSGVGPITSGDRLHATLDGQNLLRCVCQ